MRPEPLGILEGSTGGVSTLFTQPAYQAGVVPTALATESEAPHRTVPDIAANAGSLWQIGFTGAASGGGYGVVPEGGTSGASPLVSGLKADAEQTTRHAVGFADPARYRLGGSPGILDVLPRLWSGGQPGMCSADDYEDLGVPRQPPCRTSSACTALDEEVQAFSTLSTGTAASPAAELPGVTVAAVRLSESEKSFVVEAGVSTTSSYWVWVGSPM